MFVAFLHKFAQLIVVKGYNPYFFKIIKSELNTPIFGESIH